MATNVTPAQLAATRNGSHLSGSALLPYLDSYSGGLTYGAPTFNSMLVPTASPMGGDNVGPSEYQYSPSFSVGGAGGETYGLDGYLNATSDGFANTNAPDWSKFYTPSGTSTTSWNGDSSSQTPDPGTFDTAGATKAYTDWQASLAKQLGLDPSGKYFAAQRGDNPTSANGSKDSVNIIYKMNPDGSATPVQDANQHNNSSWVDFGRPALEGSAGVIGASLGLAGLAGAAGVGGATGGVGGGGISADSAAYGALENGAAYGGGAGNSLVASSEGGLGGALGGTAGMTPQEIQAAAAASDAGGGSIGGAGINPITGASSSINPITGGIGNTGTTNPLNAYLQSGASDASTIGGQGGYAGAVGSGAAPETLSSAVPGAATSTNWGNTLSNLMTGKNAAGAAAGAAGSGSSSGGGGLAALLPGLAGLGGALSGSGDSSLLNSVNYQNAATAQGQSARTNQSNAQGSLTYNQNGTDAQGNPTYSQDVKLGAPYQQNLNSALGNQGTALGNLGSYNQSLPGAYANAPGLYGNAGSQADLVKQQQDAMYDAQTRYLDPQYAQQQKQLTAQLANQGVTYGTDAYNAAMTQFGSQQNQAYGSARDSAINSGNQYANTLFNQNLAANQQYNTNLNNQGANYSNQASGALNGVVQNPTFASTPTATPYLGAAQLQNGSNTNLYNAQTQNKNNITNGLTGIGQGLASNPNVWTSIGNGLSGLFGS